MRLSGRGNVAIFAVALLLGVLALGLVQRHTPDFLRCDPSLAGTEYYHVRFGIDYATQLDRLFPSDQRLTNGDMRGTLKGSFQIEWPDTPPGRPTGDFTVRIADLVLDGFDASSASEADAYAGVLGLRLDEGCRLSVLPGVDEPAAAGDLVSRVMSLLTFSVPQRPLTEWEAEHEDNIGAYRASYRVDSPGPGEQVISRQKDAYVHLSSANQAQGLVPKIIQSSSVGRFSPGGRWLDELEGIDDVSLLHEGRAVVQTRVSYSVKKMEDRFAGRPRTSQVTAVPSAPHEAQAADALTRLADRPDTNGTRTTGVPGPASIEVLSDASLEQLGIPAALALVVDALKANPALAYALRDAIYTGSLGRDGAPLAFLVLEQADTEEAFGVLIELLENEGASSMTRSRAVYALAGARPDSMVVVQILAGQLARPGADQTLTQQSTLLAMGMMIDRIESESDPAKAMLRQLIGDHLARAQDDGARRTALAASYNAADPALYPLVVPHLKDSSPSIRTLAVEAMGKSEAPSSRSDLMRHYSKENDSRVRVATLDALTELSRGEQARGYDDADVASIASALRREADSPVRGAMIRFLGAHADHSEARAALAAQAATEKDPALLKQIGTVLSPEELARLQRKP